MFFKNFINKILNDYRGRNDTIGEDVSKIINKIALQNINNHILPYLINLSENWEKLGGKVKINNLDVKTYIGEQPQLISETEFKIKFSILNVENEFSIKYNGKGFGNKFILYRENKDPWEFSVDNGDLFYLEKEIASRLV